MPWTIWIPQARIFYRRAMDVLNAGAGTIPGRRGVRPGMPHRHCAAHQGFRHLRARGRRAAGARSAVAGRLPDRYRLPALDRQSLLRRRLSGHHFQLRQRRLPRRRAWFDHAAAGHSAGGAGMLCPAEETIWQKSYILERDRCDVADVAHLLRATGERLDWPRLLERFGEHWEVLLRQLILFGFIYPGERPTAPAWVSQGTWPPSWRRKTSTGGRASFARARCSRRRSTCATSMPKACTTRGSSRDGNITAGRAGDLDGELQS